MSKMSPALFLLPTLLLLLLAVALAAAMDPDACLKKCGDVDIPYPFGIGVGCFRSKGFEISCINNTALLPSVNHTIPVTSLALAPAPVAKVNLPVAYRCYNSAGATVGSFDGRVDINTHGAYRFSERNMFVVLGCNTGAFTMNSDNTGGGRYDFKYNIGCFTYCDGPGAAMDGWCASVGCCHVDIVPGLTDSVVQFEDWPHDNMEYSPCDVAFLVDQEGYKFRKVDLLMDVRKRSMTVWLDWAIRDGDGAPLSCSAAVENSTSYACVSAHSECVDAVNGPGYYCRCKKGYEGNPYQEKSGCSNINECELPQEVSGCFGECTNMDGGFDCRCTRGTHGVPTVPHGCTRYITGLTIGLLAASGPTFLTLVLIVILVLLKIKQGRVKRLKQMFFEQNRGQLLQQLVSQRADIAERMIIPIEELEKATNNFHQSRKLGGGSHGTVYKGILSDLHVVAIKKSKVVIKREIDEFINEVAILSQINHRNVVKLFGCCLETQVPLLVYEFVTNGTLHDHLHKEDRKESLPWRDRLRIACETAKAITYLDTSISIPIIHRDIKSANILLDDALTAKVSDFGASRYIPTDQNQDTMTAVQGTIGYLDPMYYFTRQMTEMSDVYSFGVVLIELLTRKIPTLYRSEECNGLVAHFNALISEGNVAQILDPQVVAEGGTEIDEVAALAASCTKYRGQERPTMRQVEMALEAFQAARDGGLDNVVVAKAEGNNVTDHIRRTNTENGSRQCGLEEEFLMSASYPR